MKCKKVKNLKEETREIPAVEIAAVVVVAGSLVVERKEA